MTAIEPIFNALVLFAIMTLSVMTGFVTTRAILAGILRLMTYAAAPQHAPAATRQPAFVSSLARDVVA